MAMALAKGISLATVRATRRRGKVDGSRRVLTCAVEGANAQGDGAPRAELVRADSERLQVEISQREVPLVIDFSAKWCGPCHLVHEELEKAQAKLGDWVRIIEVDVDECPDMASELQIQGLPTLIFVSTDPQEPAQKHEGLINADSIVQIASSLS